MVDPARKLLDEVRAELAPADGDNELVGLVEAGRADLSVFATIAAQEELIVFSDWRSFLTLAGNSRETTSRELFATLANGESVALTRLAALAEATREVGAHRDPLPGCQAYPAYLAWLALNGDPADVVVAIIANFAAWGDYCARIARAMREHYGFGDAACGFFDFFAEPAPGVEDQAVAAVRAGIDAGRHNAHTARTYAKLFQSYELMFWNTLAKQAI